MYYCKHQTKCVYICTLQRHCIHTHSDTPTHSDTHTHTQAHNIHTKQNTAAHSHTHMVSHSQSHSLAPLPQPSHTPPPPPPPCSSVHASLCTPPPSPFSLPRLFPPPLSTSLQKHCWNNWRCEEHQGTQFKGMGGVGVGMRNHTDDDELMLNVLRCHLTY